MCTYRIYRIVSRLDNSGVVSTVIVDSEVFPPTTRCRAPQKHSAALSYRTSPSCRIPLLPSIAVDNMPVPRRRRSSGALTFSGLTNNLANLFDMNFVFQKARLLIFYGFAPTVIYLGLQMEPRPQFMDLFNIWE